MAMKIKTDLVGEATSDKHPNLREAWKPGQSGNPAGRPKGARNKLSEDFVSVLYEDFTAFGKTAIEACRTNSPETYVKVIAGLLPKEMHIKEAPLEEMSDDDIRDALTRISALRAALFGGDGTEAGRDTASPAGSKPN